MPIPFLALALFAATPSAPAEGAWVPVLAPAILVESADTPDLDLDLPEIPVADESAVSSPVLPAHPAVEDPGLGAAPLKSAVVQAPSDSAAASRPKHP